MTKEPRLPCGHGHLTFAVDICIVCEWERQTQRADAAESQLAALRADVERLKLALVGEDKARALLNAGMGSVCESRDELKHRVRALESAIRTHREQKADDRCIEDDDRLYAALGDGVQCDRRVGDKDAMLRNCQRFIERRCEGGGWPTYAELEAEVERLRAREAEMITGLTGHAAALLAKEPTI